MEQNFNAAAAVNSDDNTISLNNLLNKRSAECVHILNEIDFLISNSSTLPLTSKVVVDAEELYKLTEKFKSSFPTELEQSEMVIREVQSIVEDAEVTADNIINQAQAQAQQILNESKLLKEAQARADMIIAEAIQNKDIIKKEIEDYILKMCSSAENGFLEAIMSIKQTRNSIKESN